jgi:hypothetical protein
MKGITVLVQKATEGGRLYPRYDRESGILAVESEQPRPWPYGMDIDGCLVFDVDEQRILANFDLHVGMSLWRRDLEVANIRKGWESGFSSRNLGAEEFSPAVKRQSRPKATSRTH